MSRARESNKKVDVSRPSAPLQFNPFAQLDGLDALKNLPKAPEPAPKPIAASKPVSEPPSPQKSRGRLVLRRETKDRGGKVVVVVSGFAEVPGSNAVMIGDLARNLKGKLGCGGSFDRQEIVLQGDRCEEVTAILHAMGFRVAGVTKSP